MEVWSQKIVLAFLEVLLLTKINFLNLDIIIN